MHRNTLSRKIDEYRIKKPYWLDPNDSGVATDPDAP